MKIGRRYDYFDIMASSCSRSSVNLQKSSLSLSLSHTPLLSFVRKSTSLSGKTRWGLVKSLCQAVKIMSTILENNKESEDEEEPAEAQEGGSTHFVVSLSLIHI